METCGFRPGTPEECDLEAAYRVEFDFSCAHDSEHVLMCGEHVARMRELAREFRVFDCDECNRLDVTTESPIVRVVRLTPRRYKE